jgi:hypothetical protein
MQGGMHTEVIRIHGNVGSPTAKMLQIAFAPPAMQNFLHAY